MVLARAGTRCLFSPILASLPRRGCGLCQNLNPSSVLIWNLIGLMTWVGQLIRWHQCVVPDYSSNHPQSVTGLELQLCLLTELIGTMALVPYLTALLMQSGRSLDLAGGV